MNDKSRFIKKRRHARDKAMQALYQWQMTADDSDGIRRQFLEENDMRHVDEDYFTELFQGAINNVETIDQQLEQHMPRAINSVDPVERSILRIATYEFIKRHDVPYRVVLNEAVILTKKFCAERSHTFVNAVLDKVAKDTRTLETAST